MKADRKNHTRREFLKQSAALTLSAGTMAALASCTENAVNKPLSGEKLSLDLSNRAYDALQQAGGAVYVDDPNDPDRPIIVYRESETQVTAFSSRCTHNDCTVALPVNAKAVCPCHSSEFDIKGKRLSGPALADLVTYEARIENATIIIEV